MDTTHSLNALPEHFYGAAVAVGNFDGVHRGHLAVIGEAGRIASSNKIPWLVMTFEPHPRTLFRPDDLPFRLTPFPVKSRIIAGLGVECLVVPKFDYEFSQLSAQTFIDQVLVRGLRARHVVSGYDFSFGHDRAGSCELLIEAGRKAGFDFTAVSAVRDGSGEIYSSTRARDAIKQGDMREAAGVLTRPFEISGPVIPGAQRGRSIGVPTANVALGDFMRPARGVYAVMVKVDDDQGSQPEWRHGIANIGVRPTVDGKTELLEVHIFGTEDDIYGRNIRIKLIGFLRPEKKFEGLDALKAQIASDIVDAKELLANL